MEVNNLFNHATKELSTDAFLKWIILEIKDNNECLLSFFKHLGLCEQNSKKISIGKVKCQENRIDLEINYEVDSKEHNAIFENKTYTTIHSNQLERYKNIKHESKYFKYLKLARVNYSEYLETKKFGYDILTSSDLYKALDSLTIENIILTQYKEFLLKKFINPIKEIEETLISENKYSLFAKRSAQQYLIDILYKNINGLNDSIKFKSRANFGGTPWTQLDICSRDNAYNDSGELLFWRIDKRSGNYYLRLNQYSYIDKQLKDDKYNNLLLLREKITPLFNKYNLNCSRASNKGVYESEICILYFKDNTLKNIVNILPALTKDIIDTYNNLIFSY